MIKFAKQCSKLRLFRLEVSNAGTGQSVEDAKLLFAQPLIETDFLFWIASASRLEYLRGLD